MLDEVGIPCYSFPEPAVTMLAAMARVAERRGRRHEALGRGGRVSRMSRRLIELESNPLIAGPDGVTAVDARAEI